MRTILNLLWLIVSGIWSALAYAIAGAIMFLLFFLIITIPFGIASFRLAGYALWPFGRTVVPDPDAGVASTIGNIIWFILAGIWLAIGQFLVGVALCITIIGIPFGIANFKLARLSLNPLGKNIVPVEYADAARTGFQSYVPVQ
ncbi:MAG: YccF domain-containing protein [Actinomycetia bacterium]|nr:YccF domain-containing protein [Actinomycetes bacterium]